MFFNTVPVCMFLVLDFDDGLLLFKVPRVEKKPTPEAPMPTSAPQKGMVSASVFCFFIPVFFFCVYNMGLGG